MILEFYGTYSAFINAVLLGVIFGIIYDIFRILRISRVPHLVPKGKFYNLIKIPERKKAKQRKNLLLFSDILITFAEDIAFWIIVSIGEILFMYHVNGGVVRVYFILCTFLGAAFYFFTIGKITMYFSVRIIFLIRCLLYWCFYIIIYPIRLVLLLFKKTVLFIANITVVPIAKALKKRHLNIYSKKRMLRILTQSKKGFFTYD